MMEQINWDELGCIPVAGTAANTLRAGTGTVRNPPVTFDETIQTPLDQAAGLTCAVDLKKLRKREIDKNYREKVKQDKENNKRKLEELAKENDDLRKEIMSMKNTEVELKQQLQSQEEEIRQLKEKRWKLQSEVDTLNTAVDEFSKQLDVSQDISLHHENEQPNNENAVLRIQTDIPSSLIIKELQDAQAKNRELEREIYKLNVINDALVEKIGNNK